MKITAYGGILSSVPKSFLTESQTPTNSAQKINVIYTFLIYAFTLSCMNHESCSQSPHRSLERKVDTDLQKPLPFNPSEKGSL